MKKRKSSVADFHSVDQAADRRKFVNVLDWTNRLNPDKVTTLKNLRRKYFSSIVEVNEGDSVIDIGCGIGTDAQILAELVGESGKVVGIDVSTTMIREAMKRVKGKNLSLVFQTGNGASLNFPDNSFDRCFSERLFQHVADPRSYLAEMIRVARPGGKIVVADADVGSTILNHPDHEITRKVLSVFCDSFKNGWIGRRLPSLFAEFNLSNIEVIPETYVQLNYNAEHDIMDFKVALQKAEKSGIVSRTEAHKWWKEFTKQSRLSKLLYSVICFSVKGEKLSG